ncbi:MAG: hypothetical protein IKZ13_03755 [Akkermansia sp.]|nr:hypothetical protein [Akkermansia sp.]
MSNDLSELNIARVQQKLHAGERLLLMVHPRLRMRTCELLRLVLPGLALMGLFLYAVVVLGANCWVPVVFGLPFWGIASVLLISPLWHRRRMAGTVYLLTDKRAVIVTPAGWGGERTLSFPLRPNPVLKVVHHGGDYGDIIFAWERRWQPGAYVYSPVEPVGFLSVPQVIRVSHLLGEQVAAVPADAELPPPEGVTPLATDKKGRARAFTLERQFGMWLGMLCCAISFLLLLTGVCRMPQETRFGLNSVSTTATVLGQRREVSRWNTHIHAERERIRLKNGVIQNRFVSYYPTVQFTDATGKVFTVELAEPQPRQLMKLQSKVEITYNRHDPRQLCVGKPSRHGVVCCMLSCLVFIVGAALGAAGIIGTRQS